MHGHGAPHPTGQLCPATFRTAPLRKTCAAMVVIHYTDRRYLRADLSQTAPAAYGCTWEDSARFLQASMAELWSFRFPRSGSSRAH